MARGFKGGPFKALETAKTKDDISAIGIMPCLSATCQNDLAVRVDKNGWLYASCGVKDGCGRKIDNRNRVSCGDVIQRVTKWAAPENEAQAVQLCNEIDLYPQGVKFEGFGNTPAEPEPQPAPNPKMEKLIETAGKPYGAPQPIKENDKDDERLF